MKTPQKSSKIPNPTSKQASKSLLYMKVRVSRCNGNNKIWCKRRVFCLF